MEPRNYVGRCPHCGVIREELDGDMNARAVARFAENCAKLGLRFGMATAAERYASSGTHAAGCPRRTPKVARQLKLED